MSTREKKRKQYCSQYSKIPVSCRNEKFVNIVLQFKFFYYFSKKKVLMAMNHQKDRYRKIHFAVMAIEASAKKLNIQGEVMYRRLKKQDIIHSRLLKHYELLHTQSLEWVVDDTIETLENWEKEGKEKEA